MILSSFYVKKLKVVDFNLKYIFVGGSDSGGDMITQEDTIFVAGMNTQATEEEIATHFGSIGIIKVTYY